MREGAPPGGCQCEELGLVFALAEAQDIKCVLRVKVIVRNFVYVVLRWRVAPL